ncbi:MAG: YggS family pyridoxal phosphate-dependent enzyme, partial [Alloprevotella sp.]
MVNLQAVKEQMRPGVALVAVSKFHPAPLIEEAYRQGQRIFGESRVQELQAKHEALPADIEWHFIGHLQPNKVKYIAPYISLIHAVDSERLLSEIEKQGAKYQRVIPCLLELHLAEEETKYGFSPEACSEMLERGAWRELKHVQIAGLMCMATQTDDEAQVRREFHTALTLWQEYKQKYFAHDDAFKHRSWGMSHDYHIAMDEGA